MTDDDIRSIALGCGMKTVKTSNNHVRFGRKVEQSARREAVMPDGATVRNVYEAYEAGKMARYQKELDVSAACGDYMRGKYGAHRGHYEWRALGEAFHAGAAWAQTTPPRLDYTQIEDCWATTPDDAPNVRIAFARAIEAAVRKQFLGRDE